MQMGDEVHNEEKPQPVEGAVNRRQLLERGAIVAAVTAVPLSAAGAASASPLKKTRIAKTTAGKVTTLKLMSWFQYEPGRHEAWNTMIRSSTRASPSTRSSGPAGRPTSSRITSTRRCRRAASTPTSSR